MAADGPAHCSCWRRPGWRRAIFRQPRLAGPVHQFTIGGDPVGQLPVALPRTISAADQLRRSARPPDILRQASDLLLALAAVECHVGADGPGRVPPALLRDLVIITATLAGHTWLEARADSMAAFTGLQAS